MNDFTYLKSMTKYQKVTLKKRKNQLVEKKEKKH